MAKIRRRKLSLTSKVFIFYLLPCLLLYIMTSIFLTSSNNSLAIEIQSKKDRIQEIQLENQQLTIEIQSLQNKDRIYTIAENSGLVQNQDNIINIQGNEDNEAK